jgi:hypothetical protein
LFHSSYRCRRPCCSIHPTVEGGRVVPFVLPWQEAVLFHSSYRGRRPCCSIHRTVLGGRVVPFHRTMVGGRVVPFHLTVVGGRVVPFHPTVVGGRVVPFSSSLKSHQILCNASQEMILLPSEITNLVKKLICRQLLRFSQNLPRHQKISSLEAQKDFTPLSTQTDSSRAVY